MPARLLASPLVSPKSKVHALNATSSAMMYHPGANQYSLLPAGGFFIAIVSASAIPDIKVVVILGATVTDTLVILLRRHLWYRGHQPAREQANLHLFHFLEVLGISGN
jgi:hypothetical protein